MPHIGTTGPIGSNQSQGNHDNLPVDHNELAFWRLMAYVVVPIDFFEKDKRMRKLMFRFGGRSAAALPFRLWCLAAQESPRDGRLADHSAETLEVALGWTGRRGELELALIEAGFLEKMTHGYLVRDWEEQGHIWRNHVRASKAARALHGSNAVDATSTATSTA